MKQYQSISALKDAAKERLTGKFSSAVLLTLFHSIINSTVTLAISSFMSIIITCIAFLTTGNTETYKMNFATSLCIYLVQYVLIQISYVLCGVFNTGSSLFFLNLASGRAANISDLFYGFQHMFKKSLRISLVTTLLNSLCMLPYDIFSFLATENSYGKWLVYALIAWIIGMLIYIPIALNLSQSYFLLLDFPSRSPREILRLSIRIMKGRKRKLFLLQLSFLPLLFLGVLSFGMGNLWITPYMNMTMALYFLDIMKPASSKESENQL